MGENQINPPLFISHCIQKFYHKSLQFYIIKLTDKPAQRAIPIPRRVTQHTKVQDKKHTQEGKKKVTQFSDYSSKQVQGWEAIREASFSPKSNRSVTTFTITFSYFLLPIGPPLFSSALLKGKEQKTLLRQKSKISQITNTLLLLDANPLFTSSSAGKLNGRFITNIKCNFFI